MRNDNGDEDIDEIDRGGRAAYTCARLPAFMLINKYAARQLSCAFARSHT